MPTHQCVSIDSCTQFRRCAQTFKTKPAITNAAPCSFQAGRGSLKYQAEQLKPELSIKYQWIANPPMTDAASAYQFGYENYKLGVGFAFPLFLREARGNLAQIQLEAQAASLALDDKRRTIFYKAQSMGANYATTRQQADLSERLVEDYRVLVRGESRRFEVGESSLFLVNSREQSLIKAELDYIALRCVIPVQRMDFYRSLGGAYLLQP